MICFDKKIIFIHIPKTGGTSVGTSLMPEYDPSHEMVPYYEERYPKEYREFYKFTVVRNPWDKMVSRWFFSDNIDTGPTGTLEDYIRKTQTSKYFLDFLGASQVEYLRASSGELAVDYIIKYEELQKGYDAVCESLKIPKKELPVIHKTNHKHYSTYYNEYTKRRIMELYREDIKFFNYRYEDLK